MSSEKDTMNAQEPKSTERVRNDWKALMDKLSYRAVVSNVPFLAFIAFLCVLYISNNQRATEMQRELNQQHKILKELRWKYMDIKTQLLYTRMESQVIRNAAALGLKPLMLPAYKIETDTDTAKVISN